MTTIDMSGEDYSNKSFEIIPEGIYSVEVLKCELKKSKTGNNYFDWELEISEGDKAGSKLLAMTTAIKGKRWLLKQALESLGILPDATGKYNFDIKNDILEKHLYAKVEIKNEKWISQTDGLEKSADKNKITQFMDKPKDSKKDSEEVPF